MRDSVSRFARSAAAPLLVALLGGTVPADAALIVLVSTDGPGEGFNDPTPVSSVIGNPETTLGGQRRRVFDATAWRLERARINQRLEELP